MLQTQGCSTRGIAPFPKPAKSVCRWRLVSGRLLPLHMWMTLVEALADDTASSRPTNQAKIILPASGHILLTGFLNAIAMNLPHSISLVEQAQILLTGLTFLVNFLS